MLLAIDTAAGTSVAVVESGSVLSVHSVDDTRRHAEVIGDLIQRSISDSGSEIADLTGVAVGMGPGPFTGLRVGIAAAEAFANGAALPLLRVVSHDALAFEQFQHTDAGHDSTALLITTDARRQERYWSAYRGVDPNGIPHRVVGPEIGRGDFGGTDVDHVGFDHAGFDLSCFSRADVDWISAASVGLLAERMLANGAEFSTTAPLYLRSPDVTIATSQKRVS